MCGIVGGVSKKNITPILLEGLKRLEYRGYDSAGIVVVDDENHFKRIRAVGKVRELEDALVKNPIKGGLGIAHTRWATHGKPSEENAHPHISKNKVAVVHNGIIENHEKLRAELREEGYDFDSETDTEVIVHEICRHAEQGKDVLQAVMSAVLELEGAYALGVISVSDPERLIAVRKGSPLVIGIASDGHYIASDVSALLSVTKQFMFLEDGDIADIRHDSVTVYQGGKKTHRPVHVSKTSHYDNAGKGGYRHYMLKEIYDQPMAVAETLAGRIEGDEVVLEAFGPDARDIFKNIQAVQIVACGTSFHAGLVAKYWMEEIAGIPCSVEVASEFRYRKPAHFPETLIVGISQSGETADTLAAIAYAKKSGYEYTMAICNVPESSLTREVGMVFMTRAGQEVSVASTKAFTTQLVSLLLLTLCIAKAKGAIGADEEKKFVASLKTLPGMLSIALELNGQIETLAEKFSRKNNALFVGRGAFFPLAEEAALKLKEISYIHAEAYSAGELKHGALALVDENMPVIALAPNNDLLEKLKSNLKEVSARGGKLYVFADPKAMQSSNGVQVINLVSVDNLIAPIVYAVPLQLLAYHVALLKGTDVDQPRNLAKSVTVE